MDYMLELKIVDNHLLKKQCPNGFKEKGNDKIM